MKTKHKITVTKKETNKIVHEEETGLMHDSNITAFHRKNDLKELYPAEKYIITSQEI